MGSAQCQVRHDACRRAAAAGTFLTVRMGECAELAVSMYLLMRCWTAPDAERLLGLALVATRDIEDEELLLNYRLSPGMQRPDWYSAVDAAEERRRWG